MNYLITGATGFLGAHLIQQLLAEGDTIHYLARKPSRKLPAAAAFNPWDYLQPPSLQALPPPDAVINLLGEPIAQRWNAEIKKRIYDTRILATRNLVSALSSLHHPPAVLVNASATGYYGHRGDEILTESSPPGQGFLARVCTDWENEAARAHQFHIRTVPIRIATVLGREGGAFPKMAQPFRYGLGGKFGSGRQWMSWIHIQDLVRLFLFAARTPQIDQACNASAPQPVTNADFTRALAHALHRPAPWIIPQFALRLALGEMAGFLFDSSRVVPQYPLAHGFQFHFSALPAALEDLTVS